MDDVAIVNDVPVKPKHPGGRKDKLTPETSEKIVRLIRAGNYGSVACKAAGIIWETYSIWMARGKAEGKGKFYEFAELIDKAKSESEAILVAKIQQDDSWQSKAWMLERKFHERWGRKDRIEHSGVVGLAALTPEERQAKIKELEERNKEIE